MADLQSAPLPRGDRLALERTLLANERTFLAYFRTAVVFLSSGLAVMSLKFFSDVRYLPWILIGLSPLVLGFGWWRTRRVHARIMKSAESEPG